MSKFLRLACRFAFLFSYLFLSVFRTADSFPDDSIDFAIPPLALGTLSADISSASGDGTEYEIPFVPASAGRVRTQVVDTSLSAFTHDGDVRINVEGDMRYLVEFKGRAEHVVNIVAQLLDHRYDERVPPYNCYGLYLNVEVRAKPAALPNKTRREDSTLYNSDASMETLWSAFWNSTATILDSSAFCNLLPTVMMRISPTNETQTYYFIVHSHRRSSAGIFNGTCQMHIFMQQVSAERQRIQQNIFALALPIVILFLTTPYLLWRINLTTAYFSDIDIVHWIWFLPYALRDAIFRAVIICFTCVTHFFSQRRERRRQLELAAQHQRILSEMSAAPADFSAESQRARPDERAAETIIAPSPNTKEKAKTKEEEEEEEEEVRVEGEMPAVKVKIAERQKLIVRAPSADHTFLHTGRAAGARKEEGLCDPEEDKTEDPAPKEKEREKEKEKEEAVEEEQEADEEEDDERICRICREGDEKERLVSACECAGSVRWVHRNCLDHWRLESAKRNVHNVHSCEICKKPFSIGIRRRTVLWQSSRHMLRSAALVLCVVCVYAAVTLSTHAIFGEMSCRTPWRRVSYGTMFDLDGIILTLYVYVVLVLLAAFVFATVYSRWHAQSSTELHVHQFQTLPHFWTIANVFRLAVTFLACLLHALSLGFLLKLFLYRTSGAVWNWEASPSAGAALAAALLAAGAKVCRAAKSAAERWRRRREERRREREGEGEREGEREGEGEEGDRGNAVVVIGVERAGEGNEEREEEGEREREGEGGGIALRQIRAVEYAPPRLVL